MTHQGSLVWSADAMSEQVNFCKLIQFGTGRCRSASKSRLMPTSSPDASFTLEDLVEPEKEVALNSVPSKIVETNGHTTPNGAPAGSYAARLDEILLDDDNSDSERLNMTSHHNGDDEGDEDDDDEGFIYTGADASEPTSYHAKLAEVLDEDSSSGRPERSSNQGETSPLDSSSEVKNPFSYPKVQVKFAVVQKHELHSD